MDLRLNALSSWSAKQCEIDSAELTPVSGDASFRRYFRVINRNPSLIAMDAPPDKESSDSFIRIAQAWRKQGVQVPEILAEDLPQGFVLLEDFGDRVLLNSLQPAQPSLDAGNHYYSLATDTLLRIQNTDNDTLPPYDDALLEREMRLFPDWLIEKKLEITLDDKEKALLRKTFSLLTNSALSQPQVSVHRDYHSRNLMICNDDSLGVLDFQDAVKGPLTYDLVSLLRDCYIVWPDEHVQRWCLHYFLKAADQGIVSCDFSQFQYWFDLMGLQRHLKAAGIFARLSLRDGKHSYLDDIPRTVAYLARISARYPATQDFCLWLNERIIPALEKQDAAAV
jgi:aminoglycoside/choline kinase family phosphotransferase